MKLHMNTAQFSTNPIKHFSSLTNLTNTNLEVANRYPCLLRILFLTINGDEKTWKGLCCNEGARNYKLLHYQFMEAMSEQRPTINNSTLH